MCAEVANPMDRARPHVRWGSIAGFSLAELVVAILVLSIGLLGVAGVMAGISGRQLRTTSRIEMTALADSKLEELRALARTGTADTVQLTVGGSLTSSEPDHFDSVVSPSGRSYVRRWRVEAGPGGTRVVTLRIEPLNGSRSVLASLEFPALVLVR